MGLRCEKCLDKGVTDFNEKAATHRPPSKVVIEDYEGKNKCGGCGKEKATKILSYS